MIDAISTLNGCNVLYQLGYKPSLLGHSCAPDNKSIEKRTTIAAISTFALLQITTCLAILNPSRVNLIPLATVPLIVYLCDRYFTDKIAGERAVEEYKTLKNPSSEATYRIQTNLTAAKSLANTVPYHRILTTVNTLGERIISQECNPDVYHFLMFHDMERLIAFIATAHIKHVSYYLNYKYITPRNIDPYWQVYLWTKVQNYPLANLLFKHGFDINIRYKGYTALMNLALKNPSGKNETRQIVHQIEFLLDCSADKTLGLWINGKWRIARDLAVNPKIRQPLSFKPQHVRFTF